MFHLRIILHLFWINPPSLCVSCRDYPSSLLDQSTSVFHVGIMYSISIESIGLASVFHMRIILCLSWINPTSLCVPCRDYPLSLLSPSSSSLSVTAKSCCCHMKSQSSIIELDPHECVVCSKDQVTVITSQLVHRKISASTQSMSSSVTVSTDRLHRGN